MIRVRRPIVARRHMAGLSLIEMMIALIMALIVAAGIVTVFQSTSSSNQVQDQMSTLQEEGRFAIQSLRDDVANANGGYCSNTGGTPKKASGGTLPLDALRSPTVYAEDFGDVNNALYDNTTPLVAPTAPQAYSLPSFVYMRGYDCPATGACTPAGLGALAGFPGMGTAVDKRVPGTSVLTIRYLKPGSGWAIVKSSAATGSKIATTGGTFVVALDPLAGEPAKSTFTGTLALLADCSNSQIFKVTNAGGTLTAQGTGVNFAQPSDISNDAAPRVFDFGNDFQTVTYFVKVVNAGNGFTTGELVRRVNGVDQSLVRGVERLDFRYGVIDAAGNTRFLSAAQVDTGVGGAIACPPGVSMPGGLPDDPADGCLWRAVKSVEVYILMDGQTPLFSMTPNEINYIYTPDGTAMAPPSAHAITPDADQGFSKQMLRRQFTTLVALRNFNP